MFVSLFLDFWHLFSTESRERHWSCERELVGGNSLFVFIYFVNEYLQNYWMDRQEFEFLFILWNISQQTFPEDESCSFVVMIEKSNIEHFKCENSSCSLQNNFILLIYEDISSGTLCK